MDKQVNRVGLGTFPFAGVFNRITKDAATLIVKEFIDKGGYYVDSAPLYGFGEVEAWLGEALKGYPRESYNIATKCGYVDVEGKTFQTVRKSARFHEVIAECEKSLKRLRLSYIDIYWVHSPDPITPFEETIHALLTLKKEGKIREIGVSNVTLGKLREYNKSGDVKYVQNRYSLLNRSILREFQVYMRRNSIQLIPYQVIDRGQLTGKVFEDLGNLHADDLRKGRSDWQPNTLEVVSNWVKSSLFPIADRLGITIGQLSIAWALSKTFVDFVIVGMTNPKYVEVNLKANSIELTKETIKDIDEKYRELEAAIQLKYGKTIAEFRGIRIS